MWVKAMGPSVCVNWTNWFLTRLQMKKRSSVFQWKQKKITVNEKLQQFKIPAPILRMKASSETHGRSQPTSHACAQRRFAEVNWLALHAHRGGSQKPTDWHCMRTEEAISILLCMTLQAKGSLKCCGCPLSTCGKPKLYITLNPRYITLTLYPCFWRGPLHTLGLLRN